MRGRALVGLLLLVFMSALLTPSSSMAQGTPNTRKAKAKVLLDSGHMKYQLANFKDALVDYEAAFKLFQHPAILFNIAQCHRQLGNHKKALFFYKLYVSEWQRKNPNPPYLTEVNRHIDDLKTKIKNETTKPAPASLLAPAPQKPPVSTTTLLLSGVPAGAMVYIDGAVRGQGPLASALEVPAGKHRVRVDAQGHLPWEMTFLVGNGKQVKLEARLRKKTERGTFWLASGIATSALALGALGVGVGFTVKHENAVEDSDEWADSGNIGIVGFVLAGSFAVLSGVSWLMYYRSSRSGKTKKTTDLGSLPRLGVAPVKGGALVGVGIFF